MATYADDPFDDFGLRPPRESMVGKPATQPQFAKLFASAREKGWSNAQLRGRAVEINSDVESTGLAALDRAELSDLITAVLTETPWVDSRQMRMALDA